MKTCHLCKEPKALSEFNKNHTRADGYGGTCRDCMKIYRKAHYKANKSRLMAEIVERKVSLREFIWQYKSTHSCVDCGESDPVVLDFDHLSDKRINLSSMANNGHSISSILEEIAKCEVVCSNDHRRRTYTRSH